MARTFAERHIGTDAAAEAVMLDTLGYDSVDALLTAAVPASIRATARVVVDPCRRERDRSARRACARWRRRIGSPDP